MYNFLNEVHPTFAILKALAATDRDVRNWLAETRTMVENWKIVFNSNREKHETSWHITHFYGILVFSPH